MHGFFLQFFVCCFSGISATAPAPPPSQRPCYSDPNYQTFFGMSLYFDPYQNATRAGAEAFCDSQGSAAYLATVKTEKEYDFMEMWHGKQERLYKYHLVSMTFARISKYLVPECLKLTIVLYLVSMVVC